MDTPEQNAFEAELDKGPLRHYTIGDCIYAWHANEEPPKEVVEHRNKNLKAPDADEYGKIRQDTVLDADRVVLLAQWKATRQEQKAPDADIESQIKAAGADKFPRITPQDIEASICQESYFTAADGVHGANIACGNALDQIPYTEHELLTFCVLVLHNGFTVTGESACASPENFNAEIGRKIARQNAVQKIWPLMGFALREKLAQED